MGNKNSIEERINSNKKIERKQIKNRFLKWNVLKSQLTNEEKQILNSINKPENFYLCNYCSNFPLISFDKVPENRRYADNKYMLELTLEEHNFNKKPNEYISHRFRDDKFNTAVHKYHRSYIEEYKIKELFKEKYKYEEYISKDLLPFESLNDFYEYLKVAIKFLDMKKIIEFYNYGDSKKNRCFNFFELLLVQGLHGFGTLYEYKNALSIYNFLNFEDLKQYNIGFDMNNGDIIYELTHFEVHQVKKIVKLNNNDLFAFIIDIKYRFGDYKYPNCGVFFEEIKENTKYIDSKKYLKKENSNSHGKKAILKYNDSVGYEDIIELKKDKYLLLLDNGNLIIASFNENFNHYELKLVENLNCLKFIKLKSKNIFLLSKENISLAKYNENDLTIIKNCKIPILNNNKDFNYLIYELLNGNIVITMNYNKFCYFNMQNFAIQFVFSHFNKISTKVSPKNKNTYNINIIGFNQFKDKNILYYFFELNGFKINLKTGKFIKINYNKSSNNCISFDKYVICVNNNKLIINDENNNQLFSKTFYKAHHVISINQKINLFATLGFSDDPFYTYFHIFKINIKN